MRPQGDVYHVASQIAWTRALSLRPDLDPVASGSAPVHPARMITARRLDGDGHDGECLATFLWSLPPRAMSDDYPTRPLTEYREYPPEEMLERARAFAEDLSRRRTVRDFSDRPVPRPVIEACLRAAATAPNGANKQPWHFVVVSDPETKSRIREAAEEEERAFYGGRAPDEWLEALAHLGTDEHKPFLETAPYLIVVFAEAYAQGADGGRSKNYYVTESVGLATGMLIAALHRAGLATLTHTPSPMRFLNDVLGRPYNERAFLILVAGYPAPDARVPELSKKPLSQIVTWVEATD